MNLRCIMLVLAGAAVVWPASGDLLAQTEYTLPPAPSSATEMDGKAFSAEHGPCFYNPYRWMARGFLNQSALASEMKDLAGGWEVEGSAGCVGRYGLTATDVFGPWSYMLIDGVRRPEGASQAQVEAAWEASRKAAAEAGIATPPQQPAPATRVVPDEPKTRRNTREEHAPVPAIGNGYGSNALVSRSVEFRVAPGPKPSTYQGIPIVERARAWERVQTPDGRRVWQQMEIPQNRVRNDSGLGASNTARARSALNSIDRGMQRQKRPGSGSTMTTRPSSSPSKSAITSNSGTGSRSPRAGKKVGP